MKLYGHNYSTCTRKVMITLAEKELKYDFVHVELSKGEQKQPAHLARNPYGVVPVLEIDGMMMYESRAICRYLDSRFPTKSLTPHNHEARAKMEQWTSVEHSYLSPSIGKIFVQKVLIPMRGGQIDLIEVESGRAETHKTFALLDKQLSSQVYLAGEEFSLADVFVMPYLSHLELTQEMGILDAYPFLKNWAIRVSERPSWKQFTTKK